LPFSQILNYFPVKVIQCMKDRIYK